MPNSYIPNLHQQVLCWDSQNGQKLKDTPFTENGIVLPGKTYIMFA